MNTEPRCGVCGTELSKHGKHTDPCPLHALERDKVEDFLIGEALASQYGSIDQMFLDEEAPDYSRPTRRFFNEAILAAYELGKRARK